MRLTNKQRQPVLFFVFNWFDYQVSWVSRGAFDFCRWRAKTLALAPCFSGSPLHPLSQLSHFLSHYLQRSKTWRRVRDVRVLGLQGAAEWNVYTCMIGIGTTNILKQN